MVALILPHEPDMSVGSRATAQLSADNWQELWMAGNVPYQWIGAHTLLVKKPDGPYIVDTVAKTATPATAVRNALAKHPELGRLALNGPREWIASPNGQWLLTVTIDRTFRPSANAPFDGIPGKCVIVKLDGTQVIARPMKFHHDHDWQALWSRKSDYWVIANLGDYSPQITKWEVSNPTEPSTRMLRSSHGYGPTPSILGFIDENRLLLGNWGRSVQTEVVDLRLPRDYFRGSRLTIPPHADVTEIECSPRGDRLAWILSFRPSPIAPLEILPFVHSVPGHTAGEVWISNVDGTDMHPLVTGTVSPEHHSGPHYLRWTPDETQVSFIDNYTLYTIPAR